MARPNYGRGIQRLGQLATQYGLMRQQQDQDAWQRQQDVAAREDAIRLQSELAAERNAAHLAAQQAAWREQYDIENPTAASLEIPLAMPMPGMQGNTASRLMGSGALRKNDLFDLMDANRQNESLELQRRRVAAMEADPWNATELDGNPMTGVQKWDRENPRPGSAGYGGAGGSAIDPLDTKRALDIARGQVGLVDEAYETGPDGRKTLVVNRLPGGAYDETSSPLKLGGNIMAAVSDSLSQDPSRIPAVTRVVGNAIQDVENTVDLDLASRMTSDFDKSFDGWEREMAGSGDNKYWTGNMKKGSLWNKEKRSYSQFVNEVVQPHLRDGTDAVEWRTIEKWLKDNGVKLQDVFDDKEIEEYRKQAGLAAGAPAQSGGGEVLYDKNGRPYVYGDDGKARYVD